jgi:hypothetical protein
VLDTLAACVADCQTGSADDHATCRLLCAQAAELPR